MPKVSIVGSSRNSESGLFWLSVNLEHSGIKKEF